MNNKKYNKQLENDIYEFVKKNNPTFKNIIKSLNISYYDLKNYLNIIKKAREEYFRDIKIKIENSLIKKSLGYYSKEIVKDKKIDKDGREQINKKIIYKYNAPSEKAVLIFLDIIKNNKRKEKIKKEREKINIIVGFDN